MNLTVADAMEQTGFSAPTRFRHKMVSVLLGRWNWTVADWTDRRDILLYSELRSIEQFTFDSADTHVAQLIP